MSPNAGVSRRGFVKGIAGTAAVPASIAGIASASANGSASDVTVAATVVRVSHSRTRPGALRVGARASIQGPELDMDNVVLVIDDVPFAASPEDIRARIVQAVQSKVTGLLEERGVSTSGHPAVQVFGGALG